MISLTRSLHQNLVHLSGLAWFRSELGEFNRLARESDRRFNLSKSIIRPFLSEKNSTHGYDRHYVYHTAWAARVLAKSNPERHVDVSSQLQFSTLVSAFIPVDQYDYRTTDIELEGLSTGAADLLSLPFPDASIASLSCMHVVEHIGLGRYGDPLDPLGDVKACRELARVLAPAGMLLFVVPVGNPRIEFNAHRVYSYEQVVDLFPELELVESLLVPDSGEMPLVPNPDSAIINQQYFGCGCFCFRRPQPTLLGEDYV